MQAALKASRLHRNPPHTCALIGLDDDEVLRIRIPAHSARTFAGRTPGRLRAPVERRLPGPTYRRLPIFAVAHVADRTAGVRGLICKADFS